MPQKSIKLLLKSSVLQSHPGINRTKKPPSRPKAATMLKIQDFAASGADPKKHASFKGSNHPKKSRFCCPRLRPEETRLGQRQQSPHEIKILLPPTSIRRNTPRSKAAIIPRNQDFAASDFDPKKHAPVKGSNHPMKSRFCCLRHRPEETRPSQRGRARILV